jgi:hypothetical protein
MMVIMIVMIPAIVHRAARPHREMIFIYEVELCLMIEICHRCCAAVAMAEGNRDRDVCTVTDTYCVTSDKSSRSRLARLIH